MSELFERLASEWEQLVAKVKTSKSYQDAEHRYQALSDRDRLLVNILAAAFTIFLVYQLIVGPALGYLSSASNAYQKQLESYEWMSAQEEETRALIASTGGAREGSLLSVASSTAKNHELSFNRFEPIGDDRVRLWLEQVKFNNVVSWLGELESSQGVSAIDISLDSAAPGYVSVRLTLQG